MKTTAPAMALHHHPRLAYFIHRNAPRNVLSRTYKKKNSHHQGSSWPKKPGNMEPPPAPTGAMAPNNPTQIRRPMPGGNDVVSRAIAFGTMMPAPTPLRARITIIVGTVRINPEMRLNRTYMAPPMTKTFLWPWTAPTRPPMRTKVASVSLVCNQQSDNHVSFR